jgi:hypothetical protein
VAVPPHPGNWHGVTYTALRNFLAQAPSPSNVCLCVPEYIHLVIIVEGGRITRATTFEAYPDVPPPRVDTAFFEVLWEQLTPAYGVLVCTKPVFERWVYSTEKTEILEAAHARSEAFWRIR